MFTCHNNPIQINREKADCAQMYANIVAFRINKNTIVETKKINYIANKELLSTGNKSNPNAKMFGRHKGSFADL